MTTAAPAFALPTHAGIDAALAAATREVLVAGAGSVLPLRAADHDNLRRGVRYRVLLPDRARDVPACAVRLGRLTVAGAEVRTLPEMPVRMTVIDAAAALLPADRHPGRPADTAMVRLPGVVDTAIALFDRLWAAAAPLTAADATRGAGLTDRERELLALLSAGYTDESAALRLGVSVRTVRRTMSAVMIRLGARSRFQAGLKAAGRGLLAHT